jgi:aminoacyl tRNA synthase complex-interacting multifunctional protein 1
MAARPTPEQDCAQAVARLDIRVGTVVICEVHANAPGFYCADIDTGEETGPIKVALELGKFYNTPDLIQGKTVLVLVNVPERVIRGFHSYGHVLCVVSPDFSRRAVLEAPAGAANGDRVHFGNLPQVAAAQSSAVREEGLVMKVLPFLNTDANGVATVLGEHAFMLPNNSVVRAPSGLPNSPIG